MLNQAPNDWTINDLARHIEIGPQARLNDDWPPIYAPARPYGLFSISSRLRLAWMVFKGEADALRWPGQNPRAY